MAVAPFSSGRHHGGDRNRRAGTGRCYAESLASLAADPIDTIRFRFIVTSFSARACAPPSANSAAAHPQLLAHGAFFNAGSGLPDDDVIAYLMVERRADDPSLPPTALRVGGFTSKGETFSEPVDLGTVWVGEPAVATLTWVARTTAFIWHVAKAFTKPHFVEPDLPYAESDGATPAEPFKSLRVGTSRALRPWRPSSTRFG